MSVSPLMIPVTMPHLQMGPIPNMGLGVPIGHPNMGNMGNMCMDMSMRQGANQFKNPYGNGCGTTSKLGCQVSSSDEFPVESTPMEHNSPQVSTKVLNNIGLFLYPSKKGILNCETIMSVFYALAFVAPRTRL